MCFVVPYRINAATLSLLPSSSNISVGNIITVKVFVNTLGKFINNGEGIIQFPSDLLEVVSISKNSSIFSLWVEEPSFSNYTGKITFNGGIPNPGFNGQSGYITSFTFKAKKQGIASVLFSDGTIRENNGLGTDILTGKFGSVINIMVPGEIKIPIKTYDENITPSEIFNPSIRFDGNQGIIKLSNDNIISNVDYYTIQIDSDPSFKVKKDQLIDNEYYLPLQGEGNHTVNIVSFDKTGKYTEHVLAFISPPVSVPILSLSSYEIINGESVTIWGKTNYPNKQINVFLEADSKEFKRYAQATSDDGSFSITTDKIKTTGLISIYAETILSDTIKSQSSEKVYLKVNQTKVVNFISTVFYPLLYLILVLTLISIILFFLYLGWYKFFGLRKKFKDESRQTAIEVHKAMLLLKEELNNQLKSLEKVKLDRNLNKKEEAIFNEIEKNIDGVDNFIEKKLKKLI